MKFNINGVVLLPTHFGFFYSIVLLSFIHQRIL